MLMIRECVETGISNAVVNKSKQKQSPVNTICLWAFVQETDLDN
jgi:hypothetical protein